MVAIGGGKGTYQVGDKMLKAGRPVMPMDIPLGAYSEDGSGAVQLLSEMKSDEKTFLPRNHQLVSSKLYALSLDRPHWPTEAGGLHRSRYSVGRTRRWRRDRTDGHGFREHDLCWARYCPPHKALITG